MHDVTKAASHFSYNLTKSRVKGAEGFIILKVSFLIAAKITLTLRGCVLYSAAIWYGVVAQLVERLNGIQEVRGSNPLGSTSSECSGLADFPR